MPCPPLFVNCNNIYIYIYCRADRQRYGNDHVVADDMR